MGTLVTIPPFKDPQLLNFAREIQFRLGTGTGTQTGQGKPQIKKGDKSGDTYWNATDNNFWIFMNGQWMQLDSGLNANLKTGAVVKSITGEFYGWYYKYLNVRYADAVDADDTTVYSVTGFSKYPTNKSWYGTLNTDNISDPNIEDPKSYIWSNKDIPNNTFGTNKFYFYSTQGGRRYMYAIAQVNGQPEGNYTTAPTLPIDLDIITEALGPVAVTGEQVIRYANSINGVTDFSMTPTNRSFIGYWLKSEWDAASPTEKENPDNYTWKALGAVVGTMDKVFAATGQNGSLTFEVGPTSSDPTKYNDLTYNVSMTTGPTLNPGARSGYVVTQMVAQSGGGGVQFQQSGSPIAGSGAVQMALPFVGQQGTYDVRTYPFITVDQYGRVAGLAQTNSSVEYFLASKVFQQYSSSTKTVIIAHVPGQVLVYLNGVLLTPVQDYTEAAPDAEGISASITIPGWTNGNVTVYRFRKVMGFIEQLDTAPFTRTDMTLATSATQIALPATVATQTEIIFVNGVQLPDAEYTYNTVGGTTYAVLTTGEIIPAGNTVTIIAFATVNTVPKFNQSASVSIAGQTMYTFPNAPRPNNIIPSPLTYILANTINGIVIDETTTSPAFTGDYRWPAGSKTETLTTPSFATGSPLQYTVWVSDLAYT